MYPDKGGETIPGSVAIVQEIPKIRLENWGAISKTFAVYPHDEKAPNPTDRTIQTIMIVLSELNAATERNAIWQRNEILLKYFRIWVTDNNFLLKIQSAKNPAIKTRTV